MSTTILGIESSCDDTSASIIRDGELLSGFIANQEVHEKYGGVVPELASRAHQKNIVPVVDQAIKEANIQKEDISAVAFTRGPGLLGSLLVGVSFAKGFALSLNIPLVEVNHLDAHVLSLFIKEPGKPLLAPPFPFLCLLVSGGHTQIVLVENYLSMKVVGTTIDDAAGEAFDKSAKLMDLPYPGGPYIDKLSEQGNPEKFSFSKPRISDFNYSFSGLKTSFLYFLRDSLRNDSSFIEKNKADLAASLQKSIIDILLDKMDKAANHLGIKHIALAGGVSANRGLRKAFSVYAAQTNRKLFIPELKFTTDNASMIGITGYYKYQQKLFSGQEVAPYARLHSKKS